MVYPTCDNILNQHDHGSALVHNSFALTELYVEKFRFDASYEAKYTINNRKLVHS